MDLISGTPPGANPNYLALRERAKRAFAAMDYAKAGKYLEWAHQEARRIHVPALEERSYCNLAFAAIEQSAGEGYLKGLREILTKSCEPSSRYLAAHALYRGYGTDPRKAKFYAELSYQIAEEMGSPFELAISAHALGVRCLVEGQRLAARRYLEKTVELSGEGWPREMQALAKSTLGYSLHELGQLPYAQRLMEESLSELMELDCLVYENISRLNFGFTMIATKDYDVALEQADAVIQSNGSPDQRKNALYLAGEASSYLELPMIAREYFSQLQQEYYPQLPWLLDALPTLRTHRLVNWYA